ncbi:hypothetical protein E5082_24655 [Streptomyces griseoluteus]|uniref:Uncharacterized protein n=1 Tax=Streptomyces griseoluteus TaxID=29306 RepID=A0A4Z1DA54_STRGP|nr:hypothetical protein [Streptomyces griseoluteus]TGN78756.1 hypothetical protein E5082_24655 [Streptomyces griseoluteus]GHE97916.1 hypothetical protein GCM10017776_13560 [Streptomyces griseoluteus]
MKLRTTVITTAVSAAAALAATGITYASAASASAPQEAPAAVAAVAAATGGSGQGGNSKGNEGNNSKGNEGNEGKGNDRDDDDNEGKGDYKGRIQINERSYSAHPGDCITVVSGLGAKSLNIRNETRKGVEVFRGAVCDNGAPIATVGPHSSSYGVKPGCVEGLDIDKGVVASFRVVKRHHDDY